MNSVTQVWIIRDKNGKRCTTIDDNGTDPVAFVTEMVNHYETHLPDGSPYTALRYVLPSTMPAPKLADLFINAITVDPNA